MAYQICENHLTSMLIPLMVAGHPSPLEIRLLSPTYIPTVVIHGETCLSSTRSDVDVDLA